MLGKVIIDNQGIFSLFHKILAYSTAGIRSQILQSHRFRSTSRNHNGVLHGSVSLKGGYHLRHFRLLLTDSDVDTG
ncbi:hypothetical protein ES703_106657 [subsurface metagenome]